MFFKQKIKNVTALVLGAVLVFVSGCGSEEGGTYIPYNQETVNSGTTEQAAQSEAFKLVSDMGIGWNLGNSLDSCDYARYNPNPESQLTSSYQIMATYSTENYSGWDASQTVYFDGSGYASLSWKMENLNSSADGNCGKIGIQIINNEIETTNETVLRYTVESASIKLQTGVEVDLIDLKDEFESEITDGVTEYATSNLISLLPGKTTADITGAELNITVKIDSCPDMVNGEMAAVPYYEQLWGNVQTTKEMIDEIKAAGFNSVRVPVTYYDHVDENYVIDEAWLNRVEEVVNYVLDNDMYCIINLHHDAGQGTWIRANLSDIDNNKERVEMMWTQIAERFKDYDSSHLLFEGFNEILGETAEWGDYDEDAGEAVNILNQTFVDTVRKSGGNNSQRFLIVNPYGAGSGKDVLEDFVVPQDTIEEHIIAEVHYYGKISEVKDTFSYLNTKFVENNIPVIIGEYGTKDHDKIYDYAKKVISTASKYNIACFWWDDGGKKENVDEVDNYAIFNRCTLSWYYEGLTDAMMEAYQN